MTSPFALLDRERAPAPLRKFDLATFGIDARRFLGGINPSFDELEWDFYDVKTVQVRILQDAFPEENDRLQRFLPAYHAERAGLADVADLLRRLPAETRRDLESVRPYRQRSITGFALRYGAPGRPEIERFALNGFSQAVAADDYRSQKRVFQETPAAVAELPELRQLIIGLSELLRPLEPGLRGLRLVFHQMRTTVPRAGVRAVVPEGVHQDGAPYVVTALVTERVGIVGGESIVCGPGRQPVYLRTTLQPGEGLFHADSGSPYWHDVTPVRVDPATDAATGRRSIIGLDINLER